MRHVRTNEGRRCSVKVEYGFEISKAIISERKRQNITTKKLAEKAGVPPTTINDILYRPEVTPGLRTCLPILHALGLELIVRRRKETACTDSCPIEGRDAD